MNYYEIILDGIFDTHGWSAPYSFEVGSIGLGRPEKAFILINHYYHYNIITMIIINYWYPPRLSININ